MKSDEEEYAVSINGLIRGKQYDTPQKEKDERLLSILKPLCLRISAGCPSYAAFLHKLGKPVNDWTSIDSIPPLPVSVFKRFKLLAVPEDRIIRVLQSSATTGDTPSRIYVDKTTAFRQARALVAVLKEHIGVERRPFLVLDCEDSVAEGDSLTARGAAIRGIASFANRSIFGMRKTDDGDLETDFDAIGAFFEENGGNPTLLFGFSFIVWSRFVLEAEKRGLAFQGSDAYLLHSGGWKNLVSQSVSKEQFNERVATVLNCPVSSIIDFYGMVEQVGTVFVDCQAGNKHAPAFADVRILRPGTMELVGPGEEGIIELISTLPTSYPGQVLLSEDLGVCMGVDNCPCGRLGTYFRFTRRVERAELRGCGDTFAQSRELA